MTINLNTLITSGAYIGEEMQAEFGRIPPAFLPIGSAFLAQHQLMQITDRKAKWLSLPADYELTASQQRLLSEHKVEIVRVDPQKSLGLSVFQSILEIDPGKPLEILHGDTLVLAPPVPTEDVLSVASVSEQYKWGVVESDTTRVTKVSGGDRSDTLTEETLILSGYFAFTDAWKFLKCLVGQDFSFTQAINDYCLQTIVKADRSQETLDCGHLKTFYNSRKNLASARHFNTISIEQYVVHKRSTDTRKIDAEANWLRSVPGELQPFTARLIEDDGEQTAGEYSTLYSSYPTVAELYLARSSQLVWRKILDSCLDFLELAYRHKAPQRPSPFSWLVVGKLRERLPDYPEFLPAPDRPLSINGCAVGNLTDIVARLERAVADAPVLTPCIMHGDFCFPNMLFDLRSDRIQLIDPRGVIGDETTIHGDVRYDIAKLGHSIVGRYDQILGEQLLAEGSGDEFILAIPGDPLREWLEQQYFAASMDEVAFDSEEIKAAIVSLFLAMIPLHADVPDRQRALFANGLRLFAQFWPSGANSHND